MDELVSQKKPVSTKDIAFKMGFSVFTDWRIMRQKLAYKPYKVKPIVRGQGYQLQDDPSLAC